MTKLAILLISAAFASTAAADSKADLKTEMFLRVRLLKQKPETVLLSESLLDGEKAYFLSYSIAGRLQKKIVVEKALYLELTTKFEKLLPEDRQQRLGALVVTCGQPVEIKSRKAADGKPTDNRLCLDGATTKEQKAVGQWWAEIRTLLRL